jgi:hypothetical protein
LLSSESINWDLLLPLRLLLLLRLASSIQTKLFRAHLLLLATTTIQSKFLRTHLLLLRLLLLLLLLFLLLFHGLATTRTAIWTKDFGRKSHGL